MVQTTWGEDSGTSDSSGTPRDKESVQYSTLARNDDGSYFDQSSVRGAELCVLREGAFGKRGGMHVDVEGCEEVATRVETPCDESSVLARGQDESLRGNSIVARGLFGLQDEGSVARGSKLPDEGSMVARVSRVNDEGSMVARVSRVNDEVSMVARKSRVNDEASMQGREESFHVEVGCAYDGFLPCNDEASTAAQRFEHTADETYRGSVNDVNRDSTENSLMMDDSGPSSEFNEGTRVTSERRDSSLLVRGSRASTNLGDGHEERKGSTATLRFGGGRGKGETVTAGLYEASTNVTPTTEGAGHRAYSVHPQGNSKINGSVSHKINYSLLAEVLESCPQPFAQRLSAAMETSPEHITQVAKEMVEDRTLPGDVIDLLLKAVPESCLGMRSLEKAAAALCKMSTSSATAVPPPQSEDSDDDAPLEEVVARRGLEGRSFNYFTPDNPIRKWAAKVVLNPVVSNLLTILILFNTFSLAATDPQELKGEKEPSSTTEVFLIIDKVAAVVFLVEYLLKMIALGVYDGTHTLFGRAAGKWFLADFAIVLLSFAFVFMKSGGGIAMLRAFRALRPVRSIRAFSGIKVILDSLMKSLPLLGDSVALLAFSLFFWGIVGLEFYSGILLQRCVLCPSPPCNSTAWIDSNPPLYCGFPGSSVGFECPAGMVCRERPSNLFPFKYANFDNIGSALLTIFHICTLAGWADMMYAYMDADQGSVAALYFVSMVTFIAWVVINLFVAVINTVFSTLRSKHGKSAFADTNSYSGARRMWDRFSTCCCSCLKRTEDAAVSTATHNSFWRNNIAPRWKRVQSRLHQVVWSKTFEVAVYLLILANIAMQASAYRGMSHCHKNALLVSEHVFAALFLAEAVLRILSYSSLVDYCSERWNVFDLTLVIISYIALYGMRTNVSFFRSLRVFRVFRLLRSGGARGLKATIENALKGIVPAINLTLFIIFSLLVFAGLGKQLFGGELPPEFVSNATPRFRERFDNMGAGLVSLFVIMTSDNWFVPMYHLMDAVGLWAVVFFIAFYIWAVWVLLNLFTAVILENFDVPDEEKIQRRKELIEARRKLNMFTIGGVRRGLRNLFNVVSNWWKRLRSTRKASTSVEEDPFARIVFTPDKQHPTSTALSVHKDSDAFRVASSEEVSSPIQAPLIPGPTSNPLIPRKKLSIVEHPQSLDMRAPPKAAAVSPRSKRPSLKDTAKMIVGPSLFELSGEDLAMAEQAFETLHDAPVLRRVPSYQRYGQELGFGPVWEADPQPPSLPAQGASCQQRKLGSAAVSAAGPAVQWRCHMSLYLFPPQHIVRQFCIAVTRSQYFEFFIVLAITASVVLLAVSSTMAPPEAYYDENRSIRILDILDQSIFVVFCMEVVIKVIALGFVVGSGSYLSDPWNRLDFLLVLLMYIAPTVRSMRALRTLRPLRLVRRMERMKVIMSALWKSIPMIINVSLASIFIIFLFGLMGLEMYMGMLDYCTDAPLSRVECTGAFVNKVGVFTPRRWHTPTLNFDNMFTATFTLLQVVSLNNWSSLMYRTMDITASGEAPVQDSSPGNALFFVAFIVVGTFFVYNMFIGVILVSINCEENVDLLTDDQRNWRELRAQLRKVQRILHRPRPTNRIRRVAYDIVESVPFALIIVSSIICNMLVCAMRHYREPAWITQTADLGNYLFLGIFAAEVGLKITAYGGRIFFYSTWNRFDVVLLAGNLVTTIVLEAYAGRRVTIVLYIARFFRIGRILRLIKRTRGVRFLLETLLRSFNSITNAFLMMIILLFIWGLGGVFLFGNVRFQKYLNRNANFRSFADSILLLFRLGTLDGWNDVMWECAVQPPDCTRNSVMDDCGPPLWLVKMYFTSFFILGSCVVYNLLIGIIIDEFAICYSTRYFAIKPPHIEDYIRTWQMEDTSNIGSIPRWRFLRLVKDLYRRGNALGLYEQSPEYQILLFYIDFLAKQAGESGNPSLHNLKGELAVGPPEAPLAFHTMLLLLASSRVPDSALLEEELKLRRALKNRAWVMFQTNRVKGVLLTYINLKRLERSMPAANFNKLRAIRHALSTQKPQQPQAREKVAIKTSLDTDTIDYEYQAKEHERSQKKKPAKALAKRNMLALKLVRIAND